MRILCGFRRVLAINQRNSIGYKPVERVFLLAGGRDRTVVVSLTFESDYRVAIGFVEILRLKKLVLWTPEGRPCMQKRFTGILLGILFF